MHLCHWQHQIRLSQATSGSDPLKSLNTDNDPLFTSRRWQTNQSIPAVTEIKSIPSAPANQPNKMLRTS